MRYLLHVDACWGVFHLCLGQWCNLSTNFYILHLIQVCVEVGVASPSVSVLQWCVQTGGGAAEFHGCSAGRVPGAGEKQPDLPPHLAPPSTCPVHVVTLLLFIDHKQQLSFSHLTAGSRCVQPKMDSSLNRTKCFRYFGQKKDQKQEFNGLDFYYGAAK